MTVFELRQMEIFKHSSTEQHAIDFLEGLSFSTIKSIGISTGGYFEGYGTKC